MINRKIKLATRFYLFLLPAVLLSGSAFVIYHWFEYKETTERYYREAMKVNIQDLVALSMEQSFQYYFEDRAAGYTDSMAGDLVDIRLHFARSMDLVADHHSTPLHMVLYDREWRVVVLQDRIGDAKEVADEDAKKLFNTYQDLTKPYSRLVGEQHKVVVPIRGVNNEVLGFVHSEVVLPIHTFRDEAFAYLLVNIQWSVGQIFLLVFLLYWVGRSVTNPFRIFCEQVESVSLSRFERSFPAVSNILELERLQITLNTMRDNILHYQHELINARDEAMSASRAKSDFLANMSHEIRTPMNAIIGLSSLALQDVLPPKTSRYLTKISHASKSLLRIINDILDFSKIEAGKLELIQSDFLLREIFENLSDMFRAQSVKNRIELIVCVSRECQLKLSGDALRLEQVLLNLLGNAFKFTNVGEIEIQVNTIKETIDQVTLKFSIRDTGIGMTEDQIAQLFKPFSQVDSSSTRRFGGTGLGLSISQRLVEMMQGRIWVESKPGEGSIFFFTATFQRRLGAEEIEMVPPEELERTKVLVVDDNTAARNALVRMLEMFNFEAVGVGSGAEVIPSIQQGSASGRPYQLVIVDWLMPEMSGAEIVQKIRETTPAEDLPKMVLLFSDDGTEKERAQAVRSVDGYLDKPVNCSFLFNKIMEIFGKQFAVIGRQDAEKRDLQPIIEQIGGARVLLVEDHPINQEVATAILTGIGLVVESAQDGREAVKMVGESLYDVVLMDIQMPIMDGYQATQAIRMEPRFAQLPIIAMTAHAMSGDREKCLAAGMNDYVSKPIDRLKLYAALLAQIKPAAMELIDWERFQSRPHSTKEGCALQEEGCALQEEGCALQEEIPGIDMKSALFRVMGNRALLDKLFVEFKRDCATVPQDLRRLFAEGHVEQARKMVHLIKGVSGNIGAGRVQNAAGALEMAIKQERQQDWPLLTDLLISAMEDLLAVLTALHPTSDKKGLVDGANGTIYASEMMDSSLLESRIIQLDGYLAQVNSKAIGLFEAIKPALQQAGFQQEVEQMAEYMRIFKFKKARVPLISIAQALTISLGGEK